MRIRDILVDEAGIMDLARGLKKWGKQKWDDSRQDWQKPSDTQKRATDEFIRSRAAERNQRLPTSSQKFNSSSDVTQASVRIGMLLDVYEKNPADRDRIKKQIMDQLDKEEKKLGTGSNVEILKASAEERMAYIDGVTAHYQAHGTPPNSNISVPTATPSAASAQQAQQQLSQVQQDAMSALRNLGFKHQEALNAILASKGATAQDLVRSALKLLNKPTP